MQDLTPKKYIVFSDCHRGDGSPADEFARNSLAYKCALEYYLDEGYTYIELGDAEELWENDNFEQIYITHTSVYDLLQRFHDPDPARTRYLKVWGNHDDLWRDDPSALRSLFPNIQLHESIVLNCLNGDILGNRALNGDILGKREALDKVSPFNTDCAASNKVSPFTEPVTAHPEPVEGWNLSSCPQILLLHGHQADPICTGLRAKISRFLVHNVWSGLQRLGIADPTRAAENPGRCDEIDSTLYQWAKGKIGTAPFFRRKMGAVPIFPSNNPDDKWGHLRGSRSEPQGVPIYEPNEALDKVSPFKELPQNAKIQDLTPNVTIIAGHTHRPVFANLSLTERRLLSSGVAVPGIRRKEKADPVYYNTGSCVHPRCITGLEIEATDSPASTLRLVKWGFQAEGTKSPRALTIGRTILEENNGVN